MAQPRLPTPTDFPPSLIISILPPPSNSSPINILILLHGLGDTNESFTQLGRNLNLPETTVLSIQGLNPIPPIFTGSDIPAFHWGDDVLIDEGKGEIDMDAGFNAVLKAVGEGVVTEGLIEKCGFPARNIHFLGFGQGGMAALSIASSLSSDHKFGGVISIGGRLAASSSAISSKSKTPVLVCGGCNSRQITRSAVDGLRARFGDVEYVKWDKRNDSMPENREEVLPIMKFLARRLGSRAGVPEGAVEI
ncbi:Alpha/Beta hydrolase protein [Amylocarpus encephaloides]|uniref:Alpha/Beta hydrolase protein n=1 Tax=Amylocarpus encephaloides TaxID=45428 RepID=A0A9P8C0Y9_9HELO|nr:Alpha/Beta hydrolase protein [Amylocarpus encephaloides]